MEKKIEIMAYDEYLTHLSNRTLWQKNAKRRKKLTHKSYVRLPKQIIIDPYLTEKERQIWTVLSCFLFRPDGGIFPNRNTLSKLLHVKNHTYISTLTSRLQKKGYLQKAYKRGNVTYYRLFFYLIDDSIFFGRDSDNELKMSIKNRF